MRFKAESSETYGRTCCSRIAIFLINTSTFENYKNRKKNYFLKSTDAVWKLDKYPTGRIRMRVQRSQLKRVKVKRARSSKVNT